MTRLPPLETLYDPRRGFGLPLPPKLARLYGRLQFPRHPGRPYVISNFVATLDGVVSLGIPGHEGGSEISGANVHDRMVMGLLRAVADAVIVGAGTLRASPRHLWTAEYIYPPLREDYRKLRAALKKPKPPLNVIVTGSGKIDVRLPVFLNDLVPALIVTTANGASKLEERELPASVSVIEASNSRRLRAREILDAVVKACGTASALILVEGGPILMADLYVERLLDEQFLTLAPQVAGRDDSAKRPGLVDARIMAPESPVWGTLRGVKRGGEHLFLRYAFGHDSKL